MAFAKARSRTAVVVRKPITQNPKYLRLQARVHGIAKRTRHHASKNEGTLLVLGGAALPALVSRFTGKGLPTFMGIDPGLLWGGVLMAASTQMSGKNAERLMSLGTGVAAPAIARAVTTGSIKVSGTEIDELAGDDEISGDDDVSGDDEI